MITSSPMDAAKIRAEAESWLRTYPAGGESVPSDAWDWLNGRCHPRVVLALCKRIAELEKAPPLTFKDETVIIERLDVAP